jgi:hypothetical protein
MIIMMKFYILLIRLKMYKKTIILIALVLLTSCNNTENNNLQNNKTETMAKEIIQTASLEEGDLVATMKTTNGTLKIKLFNKIVPNTVNNFVGLAQE